MSITPTTPRGPVPPPPQETPEFYDARTWETAYRHFDENAVPTLLLNLQDDPAPAVAKPPGFRSSSTSPSLFCSSISLGSRVSTAAPSCISGRCCACGTRT